MDRLFKNWIRKGLHYPIQIKHKTGEGTLILKMDPILFVALTAFKMTDIASENQSFFNSIIGNTNNRNTAKLITFYKTHSGLGY